MVHVVFRLAELLATKKSKYSAISSLYLLYAPIIQNNIELVPAVLAVKRHDSALKTAGPLL